MTTPRLMLALAILPVLALSACKEEPVDLPLGTMQQMMANHVQPTADIYWMAVGSSSELIDGQAVNRDWKPETDEEWAAVAASAVKLRELAGTMATPAYADGRGDGWIQFTDGLRDAATLAEQAALSKNADAVFEAGGTLYSVCSACHQAYPPEEVPEGEAAPDPTSQGNG